ncbi:prolipoprotein diacylglyceryl transferase [Sphingomonas oligoaromativorans]|uniref:prolipoprotein diacylglyceryl transferase n=1 Tax=Sphingomonas oligoaromativorans TaxID=575322 RepID=UPI0014214710|nr:prolipoprotein diacylglyceryl transferase [Sphingomonas oligoaromativorans]NIJ34628.1 phosphatidylglycerol:prolipoprotein diacylglycerol transferase [Sphingomonas oligoaromativorans]
MPPVDPNAFTHWTSLGLSPIALQLGPVAVRWYSLAYITGILAGWWYLLKLLDQPGAPMARRHADDFVFDATLGVLLGGRIGYVLFYRPDYYLQHPVEIFKLWEGGMSFHGGAAGVLIAILFYCRRKGLNWLRVTDYIACVAPIGLFFGRLANFVNGELWGKPSTVPWAIVFPGAGDVPRHPSELYEAGLEGLVLFAILSLLFWKSDARYKPGFLAGSFVLGYGVFRFIVEFFREPDEQLVEFARVTHLHMGQWLCVPMILVGLYVVLTAKGRRQRVEPVAGDASVA